jgi:hypothetical protein
VKEHDSKEAAANFTSSITGPQNDRSTNGSAMRLITERQSDAKITLVKPSLTAKETARRRARASAISFFWYLLSSGHIERRRHKASLSFGNKINKNVKKIFNKINKNIKRSKRKECKSLFFFCTGSSSCYREKLGDTRKRLHNQNTQKLGNTFSMLKY